MGSESAPGNYAHNCAQLELSQNYQVLPARPVNMAAQHENMITVFDNWRINIKAYHTRHA